MPLVTVTKTDKTQKGKDRVYFDNRHGWADAYYVGQKCPLPVVGQQIEPMTSSKDFDGDGKLTWFLNDWKPISAQATQGPQSVAGPPSGKDYSAGQVTPTKPKGWAIDYGDLSRFTSNVVGQAITAGLIKRPSEIAPWIAYCYRSLEAVREGKPIDFDDDPREIAAELPDPAEPQGYEEGDPGFDDADSVPF